jgi:replicative DNA helicase
MERRGQHPTQQYAGQKGKRAQEQLSEADEEIFDVHEREPSAE